MVSLLTNTAAMSALRLLKNTQQSLGEVQDQASTGLRVSDASDNAAYWSIATNMRSETAGLAAGQDALALEVGILQTAQAALGLIRADVEGIGGDLIQALQPGVDKTAIEGDIAARQRSIVQEGSGASFDGINLLVDQYHTDRATLVAKDQWGNSENDQGLGQNYEFLYSVPSGAGGNAVGLHGFNLFTKWDNNVFDGPAGFGSSVVFAGALTTRFGTTNSDSIRGNGPVAQQATVLSFSVTAPPSAVNTLHTGDATEGDLRAAQTAVGQALQGLASIGAQLGGQINLVTTVQDYTAKLSDAVTAGIGALVDADMDTTSTRLRALQVRQQLGVQALGVANADGAAVLKLFQSVS